VFCGGTDTTDRPSTRSVLQLTAQFERAPIQDRAVEPRLLGHLLPRLVLPALLDLDIFLTCRSSTNTTAWFLLISFEDWCRKSFLMLAMRWCNLAILAFTFFQLLENFFFRAMRRCNFANFGSTS